MPVISVIVGSTRQARFSEKPAHWVLQRLKDRAGVDTLCCSTSRTSQCPFSTSLCRPQCRAAHRTRMKWSRDGPPKSPGQTVSSLSRPNIITAPPAVLKNALDWVYPEWNRKAAAFVSYGGAAGTRSVQQLRETAIELQLAPIRSAVHIPAAVLWAHFQGGDVNAGLAELEAQAKAMIDDLLWWTAALKTARATAS
jgi:NAD(P)H-dependent FMN reductase